MAYPVSTWAKMKAEYEAGETSIDKLSQKYEISPKAVENKIHAEGWKKGSLKPIIEAKIQETTAEMFARLGLPKEKLLSKIIDGLDATRTYIKKDGSGEGFIEVEPDHNAIVKYIAEINKMTGNYATTKLDVDSTNVNINTEIDLSSLTDDELATMQQLAAKARRS